MCGKTIIYILNVNATSDGVNDKLTGTIICINRMFDTVANFISQDNNL